MAKDAEKDGAQWAQMRDKRITAVGKFFKKNEAGRTAPDIKRYQGRLVFYRPPPGKAGICRRIVPKNTPLFHETYRQTGTFRLGPDKFSLRLFRRRLNAKAPIRPLLYQKSFLGFGGDYHSQNNNDGFKNRRKVD